MKAVGDLYLSELLSLSQVAGTGESGINIQYENGVATFTITAILGGGRIGPPIEGAEMVINGVRKITDHNGQVRFPLEKGAKYTAYLSASGYEDAQYTFTV